MVPNVHFLILLILSEPALKSRQPLYTNDKMAGPNASFVKRFPDTTYTVEHMY